MHVLSGALLVALLASRALGTYVVTGCSAAQSAVVAAEMAYASQIAAYGGSNPAVEPYFSFFFPASVRNGANFQARQTGIYQRLALMAGTSDRAYTQQIVCDNTRPLCQQTKPDGSPAYAGAMSTGSGVMYLCDAFFTNQVVQSTKDVLAQYPATADALKACQASTSCNTLTDLRKTKSGTLLHEFTHTAYGMNNDPQGLALDYAYGNTDCQNLALGTFDRSKARYQTKKPLCPKSDGTEGVCPADKTLMNADSIIGPMLGAWWSTKCGYQVPINPGSTSKLFRRQSAAFCNLTMDTTDVELDFPFDGSNDTTTAASTMSSTGLLNTTSATTLSTLSSVTSGSGTSGPSRVSASTTSLTSATSIYTPACTFSENPSMDPTGHCVCTNGLTTHAASSTGSNTGSAYNPCPWTVAPAVPATTTSTTSAVPSGIYQFTQTLLGTVKICETSTLAYYGGFIETMCAGSSAIVSTPSATPAAPSLTAQIDPHAQNIGQVTDIVAFQSSLVSIIGSTLCKPPPPGQTGQCSNKTVSMGKAKYINGEGAIDDGEMTLSVGEQSYQNQAQWEMLLEVAVGFWTKSIYPYNATELVCGLHSCMDRPYELYGMARQSLAQLVGVDQIIAELELNLAFISQDPFGGVDCNKAVNEVGEVLEVLFSWIPDADLAISQGILIANAACDLVSTVTSIIASATSIIGQATAAIGGGINAIDGAASSYIAMATSVMGEEIKNLAS